MTELLGKTYRPGEIIVKQGEIGDCMYVIQDGAVDVLKEENGVQTVVDSMHTGDIFGEMAIIDHTVRSSTVRASTPVRILTIDKKTFIRRVQEDPSLALSVLKVMSQRVRNLDLEVAALKQELSQYDGQ
ncbi:MAG: cyclic nucleotide-binding domain-containing protein [Acidiferrobacterales bacterium]|nr:cyclic nucleotide-binding domain-containing protein [Acidiferrobacterales bacterium]